jgi:hypothetical protein
LGDLEKVGNPRFTGKIADYRIENLKNHDIDIQVNGQSALLIIRGNIAQMNNSTQQFTWKFNNDSLCVENHDCVKVDVNGGQLIYPDGSEFGRIINVTHKGI